MIAVELPGARVAFTTVAAGSLAEPERRAALAAVLGTAPVFVTQVHGNAIHHADQPGDAADVEADGVATATPGVVPAVRTADCLAIALAGRGAVAMVHAGWQGLASGVIDAGVKAVRDLGDSGAPIHAAIGPAAGRCCYEVGDELRDRFASYGEEVRHGRNLDLKLIARRQLETAGVESVHDVGICTICADPSVLYSHRRDAGVTGRQAGLAWLT